MRILYFINGLSYKGGMARIVVDKANYLSDVLGHEVTICTYNGKVESAFKFILPFFHTWNEVVEK